MPSPRRNSRNRSNSRSGLSRSATVVMGQPLAATQAPAASQFPACGNATIAPRPVATSSASQSDPPNSNPCSRCSAVSDGSRNASSQ